MYISVFDTVIGSQAQQERGNHGPAQKDRRYYH